MLIIGSIDDAKFSAYLKKNHYAKWEEITTIPYLGSGCRNVFREIKFLFSKDTLNDPILAKLKSESKSILSLLMVNFIFIVALVICIIFGLLTIDNRGFIIFNSL